MLDMISTPFCTMEKLVLWAPRLPRLAPRMARKLPSRVERELRFDREIARLVVAEERLVALAGPLDRPADAARRPRHQREFGIDHAARAEIAADVAA